MPTQKDATTETGAIGYIDYVRRTLVIDCYREKNEWQQLNKNKIK